jgi:Transposase DNA-binding/Transposase DDE domain
MENPGMDATTAAARTFGARHFGRADLGDQRRNRRLVQLADDVTGHPGGTLPDKLRHPKDLKAFYRLMNQPRVTHESILAPHRLETQERMRAHDGVVLVVHDTTTLDYSTLTSLAAVLGQVGDGHGRGYLCHNTLAVAAETKEILGLANQILFHRPEVPPGETKKQRQQRDTRESRLWKQGSAAVPPAPAGQLWVEVSDRGSDLTEFLDYLEERHKHYVVRAQHNRCIRVAVAGVERSMKLFDWLRTLPEQGRRTIKLSERPERSARTATVALAWTQVTIVPPRQARGEGRGVPLTVWALRVWEVGTPAGAEPVEWFLLTNVAVPTLADAWLRVDWYCQRWVVEELHKGMKTGCAIESLQFTTEQALQPAIAFLSVVALWLLSLRTESRRPEAETKPARAIFPLEYVEVLSLDRYGEVRPLTVREFCRLLGRRGGHQNRKQDRPPGWLVLWRGWMKLHLMVQGARAVTRKNCG